MAEVKLGDVISVKHGFAFPGSGFSEDPQFPTVVTPGNFAVGGGFRDAKPKTFNGDFPESYILPPGSLIVTMTDLSKSGDTLGLPAQVPNSGTYLHNQRIGLVEVTAPDRLSRDFLLYLLRTREYRHQILASATGSTVRHTSPQRIGDCVLQIPNLGIQRAIAGVLSALDDKIAANTRAVEVADALASAVLLAAAGEHSVRLDTVAEIIMGSSPPGASYNESGSGLPFYQGVRDFGPRFPQRRVWTTAPGRLAHNRDTLLSVRAPVGRTNMADEELCIGRGLAAIRSKQATPFTLFHQLGAANASWAPYEAEGTVFGAINRAELSAIEVPAITRMSTGDLEDRLGTLETLIAAQLNENASLSTTRDELLPLLMSGKITVRDAEKTVEDLV